MNKIGKKYLQDAQLARKKIKDKYPEWQFVKHWGARRFYERLMRFGREVKIFELETSYTQEMEEVVLASLIFDDYKRVFGENFIDIVGKVV